MRTKFLSAVAISILLFASCSKDNDNPDVNNGQVKFSSGIAGMQTKVSGNNGDEWDSGEKIGIFMMRLGTQTIAEGAANIGYTAGASGASTTFSATNPIFYPMDQSKVEFIAYHPYATLNNNETYNVEVTNQNDQTAIDLMRAATDNSGNGYHKTSNATVDLTFHHKLTKLIFEVTPGSGLSQADLDNLTVTVKGLNTKAEYNTITDVLDTPNTVANIVTKPTIVGTYHEAIVIPQTATSVMVEFALNNAKNERFVYNMPTTLFAAADKHVFTVTVQRTAVEVTGSITPWTPKGTVSGVAK